MTLGECLENKWFYMKYIGKCVNTAGLEIKFEFTSPNQILELILNSSK